MTTDKRPDPAELSALAMGSDGCPNDPLPSKEENPDPQEQEEKGLTE